MPDGFLANPLQRSRAAGLGRWPMVLGLAGVLYCLQGSRLDVGHFVDDAVYITAAQSLIQGHYAALYHPQASTLTQFPPGYPLFLTPFVYLFQPHWPLLKFVSLVLTLGSVYIAWRLFKDLAPGTEGLAGALLALNPITVQLATSVMSEPLYLFLSLSAFWLLWRTADKNPPPWLYALLGLVIGWAGIVRTVGVVLIVSLLSVWLFMKRWRALAYAAPFAFIPTCLVLFFNARHAHTLTAHSAVAHAIFNYFVAHGAVTWFDHVHRIVYFFLVYGVSSVRLQHDALGILVSFLLIIPLLVVSWAGVKSLLQKGKTKRMMTRAFVLYVTGYLLIHAFWTAIDSRFVLPILPFLLLFLVEGIRSVPLKGSAQSLKSMWVVLLLAAYAQQNVVLLRQWYHHAPPSDPLPKVTFEYIQQTLPLDAVVLYPKIPTLYLYTGRHGVGGVEAPDETTFRDRLLAQGVTYALLQRTQFITVKGFDFPYAQNQRWILSRPEEFPIVYQNVQENTVLCQVRSKTERPIR